jgi:hypothetical protein
VISEFDTDFVYSLFPSLLIWRTRGARCRVFVPKGESKMRDGHYRRRLLSALGADVVEVDAVPFRGFFINCDDPGQGAAYVGVPSQSHSRKVEAIVYEGAIHAAAISSLYSRIVSLFASGATSDAHQPRIVPDSQESVRSALRSVTQYGKVGVDLTFESIRIADLLSLTRYVREYKYRQIAHLIAAYRANNLTPFEAAAVSFADGRRSIITPPVVEAAGDKFILIEGSTRATFLRDEDPEGRLTCIVVRGVKDPLPSGTTELQSVRIAGRTLEPDFRYEGFNYALFRHIERQVHPLDSL